MNNLEKAQKILENVIAKEFTFYLYETKYAEDGSMCRLYTEKSDRILNEILKILDNE